MRIGELSVASGCHVETIRYYERVGLVPAPTRSDSGYRAYSAADVQRLRFVVRARELGFGLDEIRDLLALSEDPALSCAEVDHLAQVHLSEIRQRVRELSRMARELAQTIAGCRGGRRAQCAILDALARPAAGAPQKGQVTPRDPVHRRGRAAV